MNQKNSPSLAGKTVAILATHGFEESELIKPLAALEEAGADTTIVSLKGGSIKGWTGEGFGKAIPVDQTIDEADEKAFDALVLPGGVLNPDTLRMNEAAVKFVRSFFDAGKPVAAICHGPQLLIEADVVEGRRLTSYPSIRTDLVNAGADWVDEAVVVDQGLVTSRTPDDLPDFIHKMLEEIAEGVHSGQHS